MVEWLGWNDEGTEFWNGVVFSCGVERWGMGDSSKNGGINGIY